MLSILKMIKGQNQNFLVNFQIVEEIPRIDLKEVVKNLEKNSKFLLKEKVHSSGLLNLFSNVFLSLYSSKPKRSEERRVGKEC